MKKILCGCVCALTLLLCGCENAEEKKINLGGFYACDVKLCVEDETTECRINRIGDSMWEIDFISPERLNGVRFCVSPEDYTIIFDNMTAQSNAQRYELTDISYVTELLDLAARGDGLIFEKCGENYCAELMYDTAAFVLTVDKSSQPIALSCEVLELEAEFLSFEKTTA